MSMSIPFFYLKHAFVTGEHIDLPEEKARHIVQVLRMQEGEKIRLTDGQGRSALAVITDAGKKKCLVSIEECQESHRVTDTWISIAISPLKNASRFEWFLEKATELGVNEIIPLISARTEKQHLRMDRLQSILISAMLQSQQHFLPVLREAVKFSSFIREQTSSNKWIAHCEEGADKKELAALSSSGQSVILIGPEGDFTPDEVQAAIEQGFVPVSLGSNRLRTETAGVTAAVLLTMVGSLQR